MPIGGANGIPTATKEVTYTSRNIAITYTRIGNVVTATSGARGLDSFATTEGVVGVVPDGYTPVAASAIVCAGYHVATNAQQATYEFVLRPNKEVNFSTAGWTGLRNFVGSTTYITADDFPTP